MSTSARIADSNLGNAGNRIRDVDGTVLTEDSTVAMGCILAEAHITGDVEFREKCAETLDS